MIKYKPAQPPSGISIRLSRGLTLATVIGVSFLAMVRYPAGLRVTKSACPVVLPCVGDTTRHKATNARAMRVFMRLDDVICRAMSAYAPRFVITGSGVRIPQPSPILRAD